MRWWHSLICNVQNQVAEVAEMTTRPQGFASNRMKHPLGSGVPGKHNWSGTDENTCRNEPLGGLPELVQWSASMVKTPHGWVGRIDNYAKKKTIHVPVVLKGIDDVLASINQIRAEKAEIQAKAALTKKSFTPAATTKPNWRYTQSPLYEDFEDEGELFEPVNANRAERMELAIDECISAYDIAETDLLNDIIDLESLVNKLSKFFSGSSGWKNIAANFKSQIDSLIKTRNRLRASIRDIEDLLS